VQALGRGFHTGARRLRSPLQDEGEGKEGKKKIKEGKEGWGREWGREGWMEGEWEWELKPYFLNAKNILFNVEAVFYGRVGRTSIVAQRLREEGLLKEYQWTTTSLWNVFSCYRMS